MKHGPATPKIVNCESVPEYMEGATWRTKAQLSAKQFHVSQDVVAAQSRFRPVSKKQKVRLAVGFPAVAEHYFPQLKTEGDKPLLPSFAVQSHEQVVEVNLADSQMQRFTYSASRVQQEKHEQMETPLILAFRLPQHKLLYLDI